MFEQCEEEAQSRSKSSVLGVRVKLQVLRLLFGEEESRRMPSLWGGRALITASPFAWGGRVKIRLRSRRGRALITASQTRQRVLSIDMGLNSRAASAALHCTLHLM